ncbi:MAG: hypothetical protein ABI678_10920 [Kofleriaceae bacterium]
MTSTSYTAVGGSRLTGRDGTIYWTENQPDAAGLHQIVAASRRGKFPVLEGIPLPPARMRGLVVTATELVWHDGATLRTASIDGGEVTHLEGTGLGWVTCVTADREAADIARAGDREGSVIGRVAHGAIEDLVMLAGTVDQLVVAGRHLAWTLHGAGDIYVRGAVVFSTQEPFALCAAGTDHLVIAVGAQLLRLALETGELDHLAEALAPGWPHAVAWHAGVAYIARHEIVHAGVRLGGGVERVDLAEGTSTIVHARPAGRTLDQLVANDHGLFCVERAQGDDPTAAIVHITAEPVERSRLEARGTRTGGGIRVDSAYGKLRIGFVGEVVSCTEVVRKIASDAPRKLELLCAPASPGELFSTACAAQRISSVLALVAPNTGDASVGQLGDVLGAFPALERALISGAIAFERCEHAALRELHLEGDKLDPGLVTELARSQLPALECCALAFKRVSTAQLLKLVDALAAVTAPNLRQVHFGGLRGLDQIRDVTQALAERKRPVEWEVLSFGGALAGEDTWLDVADSIRPPGALKIALPLDLWSPEFADAQLRRRRWLVDVAKLSWAPCDVKATQSW